MKGLFVKDLRMIKVQKNFFFLIFAIAIGIALTTDDIAFLVGYLTFVLPLFSLSTISYDEYDNGNAFLFTLPFSRRDYVLEKYGFALLLGACSWLISVVLCCVIGSIKNIPFTEALASSSAIFGTMVLLLSVMLPIQFKFGTEKSRPAMLILGGCLFLLGYGGFQLFRLLQIDLNAVVDGLVSRYPWALIAGGVGIVIAAPVLSFQISVKIMNRKEF